MSLGLADLPSDRVMDDIDKALQPLCGIQSIRYSGKLGHVYYTNDFAAIIAQVRYILDRYGGELNRTGNGQPFSAQSPPLPPGGQRQEASASLAKQALAL